MMVARLRKAYVAVAADGAAKCNARVRRSLRRRPGMKCLEPVRKKRPVRDGMIRITALNIAKRSRARTNEIKPSL
jgi:hypothetical protein